MFGMLGIFAQFERSMIKERVHAGLKRARAQGKKLGRPPLSTLKIEAVRRALKEGKLSIRKIAKGIGVSAGAVQRVKRAQELRH